MSELASEISRAILNGWLAVDTGPKIKPFVFQMRPMRWYSKRLSRKQKKRLKAMGIDWKKPMDPIGTVVLGGSA